MLVNALAPGARVNPRGTKHAYANKLKHFLEDVVALVLRDVAVGVRSLFAQLTG